MSFETVLASIFSAAFIATILRTSTPLILAAMGGLISELGGVINIALEGIMLSAAFFGVAVGALAPEWLPGLPVWLCPWLGALAGIVSGLILTLVIGFFHLELGADIILAALGVNILASGGTLFFMFGSHRRQREHLVAGQSRFAQYRYSGGQSHSRSATDSKC